MNTQSLPKHWLVIYTKSRNEKAVANRLRGLGIEVYCPMKRTRRKWSDRWKWVEEPLFSSYCFVRLAQNERNLVLQVPGFVRYLFWLGQPAVVRDEEIERLRIWLNEYDHDQIELLSYNPGETVCICSGPLMDRKGHVVSQQGDHLYLRIEGLALQLRISLKESKVVTVGP